jgi:hypothetical protein
MLNYTGEIEELFYEKLDNLLQYAAKGKLADNLMLLGRYDLVQDISNRDWNDSRNTIKNRAFIYNNILRKLNLEELVKEPIMVGTLVAVSNNKYLRRFSGLSVRLDSSKNKLVDIDVEKGKSFYFEADLSIENQNYEHSQVVVSDVKAISKNIYITEYSSDLRNIFIKFKIEINEKIQGTMVESIILNTNMGLSVLSLRLKSKPVKPLFENGDIKNLEEFYGFFNNHPEKALEIFKDKRFYSWLWENEYKNENANYNAIAMGERSIYTLQNFLLLCGSKLDLKLEYELKEDTLVLKNTGSHAVKAVIKKHKGSIDYSLMRGQLKEVELSGLGDNITLISNGMDTVAELVNPYNPQRASGKEQKSSNDDLNIKTNNNPYYDQTSQVLVESKRKEKFLWKWVPIINLRKILMCATLAIVAVMLMKLIIIYYKR